MTLVQRIRLILDGPAQFARGGGGRKSAKGGKSSKKGKGVAQAGKGGACCKVEGGKFGPGNNYGSLNRGSAKAAASRAGAKAGRAAAKAGARVEATKAGSPFGAMLRARSAQAAAKGAQVKAARDRETAVAAKKVERNAKARKQRAAKKADREAMIADRRSPARVERSKAAMAAAKAKQEAAKPARAAALKGMVARSTAASTAAASSRKAPIGARLAAAKAKQAAEVKKAIASRDPAKVAAQKAESAAATAKYQADRAARKAAARPRERDKPGEREARWRAAGIQPHSLGTGKGTFKPGAILAKAKARPLSAKAKAAADEAARADVARRLELGQKIPRSEVARQIREYRAFRIHKMGVDRARVNASARRVIREHAEAKAQAAKPTGDHVQGRKNALGRVRERSANAANKAGEKAASAKAGAESGQGKAFGRGTPARAVRAAAVREARAGVQRISKNTPITEKVSTKGGVKTITISRGPASMRIVPAGDKFQLIAKVRGKDEVRVEGPLRQLKAHARADIARVAYVEKDGSLRSRYDPPARGQTRPANVAAREGRTKAIGGMVKRSKEAATRQKQAVNLKAHVKRMEERKASDERLKAENKASREQFEKRQAAQSKLYAERRSRGVGPRPDKEDVRDRSERRQRILDRARDNLAEAREGMGKNKARNLKKGPGGRMSADVAKRRSDLAAQVKRVRKAIQKVDPKEAARLAEGKARAERRRAQQPRLDLTKGDRAASLKRLTDRSRVASGKAGAEAAARKREAASASKPTPVTPPPASIERRPISDPVRLRAESSKMDEAFGKAPGARDNFVTLANLKASLPHLSREEFVAVVRKGQDEGKYSLDSHEGLSRPLTPAEREAAITDASGTLVYISRRASIMSRKTVRTPLVVFSRSAVPTTPAVDGMVRRRGVIFRSGVFPEKSYAMTPAELRAVAADFEAVPIDLGHPSSASPLDGQFGHLESVDLSDDGTTLYGVAAFPGWFDALLGDAKRKVSASWDRATKRLRSLSLVTHPHIEEAELQAAFACACGGHPAETVIPEERPMTKREQDIAALQAMSDDEYDAVDAEIDAYDDPETEEEEMDDEDTDPGPSPAEFAALVRIAELEAKDRRREAEVFVDAAIKDSLAVPAEREELVATLAQFALDDQERPAEFAAGSARSRVERFKAQILARRRHGWGRPVIPGSADFAGRVLDNGGDRPETDAEYAARLVSKYNGHNRKPGRTG